MIKTRKETGLTLDDILALLVHLYSLAGDLQEELFTLELEDRLKGLLAENMVHEDAALSEPIQDFGINIKCTGRLLNIYNFSKCTFKSKWVYQLMK